MLVPCVTARVLHGAPARPGRSSHFPMRAHNWTPEILAHAWDWGATVSTSKRRISPRTHWKSEWGSPLFGIHLLQTGKYAKIWFAENPGIVLISVRFFSGLFQQNCSFILTNPSWLFLHEQLFIFRTHSRVNLQCNHLVKVIYVMFSLTPDFYLNDSPSKQ